MTTVIEVKLEGKEYCGYYYGSPVTKGKDLVKVLKKLSSYAKGQS